MDNTIFSKFTPKEKKFFPLLKEIVEVIKSAADLMLEFVEKGNPENAAEYYKKIKDVEHKGDELSNKIFDELNSTFITPFDREDIHHLANTLDDITDDINSAAKRIFLYNPLEIPEGSRELVLLIKEAAELIEKAVDELDVLKKNRIRVSQYCAELHIIENKADDVYDNFLIQLFEKQHNSVELIKQKEIMSELEKATDDAEHVGKIIKTIIIKYA
jgi:predicted phosphate transport protein (TIGR00153 family)